MRPTKGYEKSESKLPEICTDLKIPFPNCAGPICPHWKINNRNRDKPSSVRCLQRTRGRSAEERGIRHSTGRAGELGHGRPKSNADTRDVRISALARACRALGGPVSEVLAVAKNPWALLFPVPVAINMAEDQEVPSIGIGSFIRRAREAIGAERGRLRPASRCR